MRLTLLLLLFMAVGSSVLQAQNLQDSLKDEISIGLEYAAPIGEFREKYSYYNQATIKYNYGYGASVKYVHRVTRVFGVSLQAGFIGYNSTNTPATTDGGLSFTAVPVKLGANFRYKALFAEPQLGLTWFNNDNILYQNASTTYGLQLGGYITKRIALSGNFERWNRGGFGASHLGVRLAFNITPKKYEKDSMQEARALYTALRPQYDKTSVYWKRHRTFKTLGWVSTALGPSLLFAGMLTAVVNIGSEHAPGANTYLWIFGSGIVVSASAIPFFILSHHNKQLARLP